MSGAERAMPRGALRNRRFRHTAAFPFIGKAMSACARASAHCARREKGRDLGARWSTSPARVAAREQRLKVLDLTLLI